MQSLKFFAVRAAIFVMTLMVLSGCEIRHGWIRPL